MVVLAGVFISIIYFLIAELLFKKFTGRYFDVGYHVRDKEGIIMTSIVVLLALSTGPFIISFFSQNQ